MFKKIVFASIIGAFVFSLASANLVSAATSLQNAAKANDKTDAQIIKAQNKADALGAKLNTKKAKKKTVKIVKKVKKITKAVKTNP
jgi:hypothetical protein